MGCDGGTIPRRDELVRTKKKPEQKDREAEVAAKWQYCALTCNKLCPPIVACELGRIYNKVAVIEYLLNKDVVPNEVGQHLRNLKDVVTLQLTERPEYREKGADNGGEYVDRQDCRYICPVVGLDMNGNYRFSYIRTCGCVLSERALKEVKSDVCHKCGKAFLEEDVIVINGTEEEVQQLRVKMEERRAKAKSEKRSKKRKAEAAATATASVVNIEAKEAGDATLETAEKKVKAKEGKAGSGSKSSLDSGKNIPSTSTTKTSTNALLSEKARSDYSVAKDPQVSETYKSIFTSHKDAQNQPRAHWVTYNPLYF